MGIYPKAIGKRSSSPNNAQADSGGVPGIAGSFVCGSFIEISVRMIDASGGIDAATFRTNGCGFMIAAADSVCDWLKGKEPSELHGLSDEELLNKIGNELEEFPADRVQCAEVVFQSLRNAMSLYRERLIAEFQGEKALICTCFGVSEESIIAAISENGFTEVEQVAEAYRAGSGCGSCRFLIQELIDMRSSGID